MTPSSFDDVVECSDPSAIRLWAWHPPGAFAPDCATAILHLIGGACTSLSHSRVATGCVVYNFRQFPLEIFEQIDMRQAEEIPF
ncbi:MAG: hypothetical protein IPK15_17510 [Verrucomicrobia bacterium]|nr:hypothetical protein [Verrucomicrobiota bacterium]